MCCRIVEIENKDGMLDVFGVEKKSDIEFMGIDGVQEVSVSSLYKISGDITTEMAEDIAGKVLVDSVAQKFSTYQEHSTKKDWQAIEVWYRDGVTDTVSETTVRAIRDAGFSGTLSVSSGTKYYIKGLLSEAGLKLIGEKVLSNPLIQEYKIIK